MRIGSRTTVQRLMKPRELKIGNNPTPKPFVCEDLAAAAMKAKRYANECGKAY
jgi:hypothetical protein